VIRKEKLLVRATVLKTFFATKIGGLGGQECMSFFFVDSGWVKVLDDALRADISALRIVCPFIKKGAAQRLLHRGRPESIQVITRANLDDFCAGVSDTAALQLLIENGARIRGVRGLHAKLYLFGKTQVILTSANLTEAALRRNHEFGLVAKDRKTVRQCRRYFDDFWKQAGDDITIERLDEWERRVEDHLAARGKGGMVAGLGDEGVYVENFAEPASLPVPGSDSEQGFVKFFGRDRNRAARSMAVLKDVESSGSHWACTYPKGKRPRQVRDGAVMFMGRLVEGRNDILIYGRATARAHERDNDDASASDLRRRPWKAKYPHYVRVDDPEFIDGTLSNGIPLSELINALQSDAFAPTQRNALKGHGNITPRKAIMRQPAVELTREGIAWMNERLERAFAQHGKLSKGALAKLDWPNRKR
jgi:hypothetical protein